MCNTYHILNHKQHYIDKTGTLEKGIAVFPSVYIEGAAACGKTTAVKMLLSNHPGTVCTVFDMKKSQGEETLFCRALMECSGKMNGESHWVIFENFQASQSEKIAEAMVDFVRQLPQNSRAVFVSREKPPQAFLDLLWKQEMTLLRQQTLLFDYHEVNQLVRQMDCTLNAEEIYRETGGWAGCVSMLASLSRFDREGENKKKTVREYMDSYEMQAFIQKEILDTLESEEQGLIQKARVCPWINERLCREQWQIQNSYETMTDLMRKGLLQYDAKRDRWQAVSLIRFCSVNGKDAEGLKKTQTADFWEQSSHWYEENGCVSEALYCLKQADDARSCQSCMKKHFWEIPFSGIDFKEVTAWTEDVPETIYLRGMYFYRNQDFVGLDREIKKLKSLHKMENPEQKNRICREVYMNLCYVSPDITLDEWLDLLEKGGEKEEPLRLYHVLGNSPMALCGLRDLSGLFACSLKEEKRKEKIWKTCLDENGWRFYQLARIDFYMETLRSESISGEDREVLFLNDIPDEPWQMSLARFYLLCKYEKIHPDEKSQICIRKWKAALWTQQNDACRSMLEAMGSLYEAGQTQGETLKQWMRDSGADSQEEVNEENVWVLYFRTKGYLLVNQYDKAKRLLQGLLPYVRAWKQSRLAAELLFQDGIVHLSEGSQGQALRSVIESFLLCGGSRWVQFYTEYGKKGLEAMELYVDWLRSNAPEGWHRKKKYNYGNVVRMPQEDYLEVILRRARREIRTFPHRQSPETEERLTMMETMVLQELGRGLTNADICQSLNLKMTTVKSHVYSVYKKLGVSSRVQAVLRGKELGIIR